MFQHESNIYYQSLNIYWLHFVFVFVRVICNKSCCNKFKNHYMFYNATLFTTFCNFFYLFILHTLPYII